jgi:hypothetical protein
MRPPRPRSESYPSYCSIPPAVPRRDHAEFSMPAARHATRRMRYPADPPTIEEIVAVMRRAGDGVHGRPHR